jgi:tryptophan synthase alpha chain
VTGAGNLDTAAVAEAVPRIRQHVKVPVGVGFGIRDAASAQAVGRVSDGVVIGSRLIQLIENEPRERMPPSRLLFCGISAMHWMRYKRASF